MVFLIDFSTEFKKILIMFSAIIFVEVFSSRKLSFILCLLFLLPLTLFSQSDSLIVKRIYVAKSTGISTPPEIDGNISDPAWELVPWSSDFTEFGPDNGNAPSHQTKMKILYDEKNLYVAFQLLNPEPEKIEKRLSRRDGFEGDWVSIQIDSYNDKRTAFSFTVSAAGVKGDDFISNDGKNRDLSWNPIWETKTGIDSLGWTAEMRIPLSQLRFGSVQEQVWGLQAVRRDFLNAELSYWQHVPANAPGYVSSIGELQGIKGLKAQRQLEIQPYALAQYNTFPEEMGNPFRDGSDFSYTAGIDAKIGLTNDLTLDLTVNPDFGQVDADPGAIALDGFEIFFEERRPFFVENKNVFDYNLGENQDNLFFSRRIGRSP